MYSLTKIILIYGKVLIKVKYPAVRNGEFNPGGSLYMDWQAYPYGSLPVGIKERDGENR